MAKIIRASLLAAAGMMLMNAEVGAAGGGSMADALAPAGDAAKPETVAGESQPVPAGMTKQVFHFKKEVFKDAAGNKIGDGKKLPSVALLLPLVTAETVLTVFADPTKSKEQQFLLDQLQNSVYLGARDQINSFREKNAGVAVPLDVLDYSKLTIEALTAAAEESGNSSKISDADWEAFYEDWGTTMLATPWTEEKREAKVAAQIDLFKKGLRRNRDKKLLGGVQQLLAIYAANTKALEDNQACYENISGYVDKWLKYEPQDALAAILG
jgi:hypothetical protein